MTKYGITGATVIAHNPSYEQLFEEETKAGLEGYEVGQQTELGAVNVMTGIYTGRSPKDKYIVMDANSKDTVWWTSEEYKNDNHPMSEDVWNKVKTIAKSELCNKNLYVVDGFCGANKDTRMAVRFIVEVAWQAHFVTNMFIRPTEEELKNFEPDFVVYNASKAKVENYKELGLNSETCVAFNVTSKEQVIINTWIPLNDSSTPRRSNLPSTTEFMMEGSIAILSKPSMRSSISTILPTTKDALFLCRM